MGALTARNQELENGKQQKREVSVFYCQKKRVPPIIRLPDIWMLTHQATVNLVDIRRILLIASRYEAVNTKGWFTRATQTQTQAQGSSRVQRKRKHSAIRKRNGVFQDGGRSRCIDFVVLSLSWSSSNKT